MSQISFADLLDNISAEIRNANTRATKEGNGVMQFEECELQISVTAESAGGGKVNLYAVQFDAETSKETIHQIKIKYVALGDNPQINVQETDEL